MEEINFTDIGGIEVGHAQDFDAATGCTVVLCKKGAMGGVDVRGSSPSTRETDGLNPVNVRDHVHAVLLTGGSAYGLDAAAGVMQYLEEQDVGRDVEVAKVPIVCGAVIFDLKCGASNIRPDKEMGYAACQSAGTGPVALGSVGAGTGATVGKLKGPEYAMKGGIGTCSYQLGELKVGALIVVNAVERHFDCDRIVLSACLANFLDDLSEETLAVFEASAIFICAVVPLRGGELVDQVAAVCMDLNDVNACIFCKLC